MYNETEINEIIIICFATNPLYFRSRFLYRLNFTQFCRKTPVELLVLTLSVIDPCSCRSNLWMEKNYVCYVVIISKIIVSSGCSLPHYILEYNLKFAALFKAMSKQCF